MPDPSPQLQQRLSADAAAWLQAAAERLRDEGSKALPELFPQAPRRLGRGPLMAGGDSVEQTEDVAVDFGAWRCCDAGALQLVQLAAPGDEEVVDLFQHGDMEERTMVLRCLSCLPLTGATVELLGEAQRTNTGTHFEAAVCDSNLLARAVADQGSGFDVDDFNRMVLKLAFVDLPLRRLIGAEEHANEELSRMLQGLATEREAAGRAVWQDTNRLIARAPTAGTVARLAGGLEHGDDGTRLAAAEGIAHVDDEGLRALARERMDREPRPEIRAALERALGT